MGNGVIRAAQLIMLEMLKEFHRICRDNNLTYWLDGGTLLGAVRQGGFIPWDDDVDVCMPRKDYNKLLLIAPDSLKKSMFFQNKDTDRYWYYWWAKIRDRNSIICEKDSSSTQQLFHRGVYIDIFPMDVIDNNSSRYKLLRFIHKLNYNFCRRLEKYRYGQLKKPLLSPPNLIKNCSRLLIKLLLGTKVQLHRKLAAVIEKTLLRHNSNTADEADNRAFVYGLGIEWQYSFPVHTVFPLATVEFEGESFYAPGDTDRYLTHLYGGNYLKPPDEKDRRGHSSLIKLRLTPAEKEQLNHGYL